jgi:hypothetical protein
MCTASAIRRFQTVEGLSVDSRIEPGLVVGLTASSDLEIQAEAANLQSATY